MFHFYVLSFSKKGDTIQEGILFKLRALKICLSKQMAKVFLSFLWFIHYVLLHYVNDTSDTKTFITTLHSFGRDAAQSKNLKGSSYVVGIICPPPWFE